MLELRNELACAARAASRASTRSASGRWRGRSSRPPWCSLSFSLPGLDDSKRVRPARRESLAAEIREVAIGFGIGEVRVEEIDQIGIYQAALEAMRRAVKSLERTATVDICWSMRGRFPASTQPQTSIIKGDQKDASIAAASIVAKVYRDRLMTTLGQRYPAYGFEQHMGYGTAAHMAALERPGPVPRIGAPSLPSRGLSGSSRRTCEAESGTMTRRGLAQPIGYSIRHEPEDFVVIEEPLYSPSGDGKHTFLFVEKRGRTTEQVARDLAARRGCHRETSVMRAARIATR